MRVAWTRFRVILTALVIVMGGIFLATSSTPAYASVPSEVCNQNGQALNAWNGGPYVKDYNCNGTQNNYFKVNGVDACHNGDYTTEGCPFPGVPSGLFIYEIQYGNPYAGHTNNCVGNDGNADGQSAFVTCPSTSNGSGNLSALFVAYHSSCESGFNIGLSVYWSFLDSPNSEGINWDTAGNGNPVYLNSYPYDQCLGVIKF